MASIRSLTQLEELVLSGTPVDDRGVRMLEGLRFLKRLDLMSTQVSDECVPSIGRFPDIRLVTVAKSRVTEAGFEKLQHTLPRGTWILWDFKRGGVSASGPDAPAANDSSE